MNTSIKQPLLLTALAVVTLLACTTLDFARDILGRLPTATPTASSASFSSSNWYVAVDGDDGNSCDDPERACRTISEAINERATTDDVIFVGPGTFAEPITVGVMVRIQDINLRLEGDGQETTILDAQDGGTGILVSGTSRVTIRNLTVRNGAGDAPGNCISHRGSGEVLIESVEVEHCQGAGIEHRGEGELRLVDVNVSDAYWISAGNGGAGVLSSGNLVVEGGEFSDNKGYGVGSSGALEMSGATVERNGLDGLVLSGEAQVTDVRVAGNDIDPELGHNHAGFQVEGEADATIRRAVIENNDIGVRVDGSGQLLLADSTVSGHPRNGLLLGEMAVVTLEGTTVSDNGSSYASTSLVAGISNEGNLTLENSFVEANHNGGVGNYATLIMRSSTIHDNFGGLAGLYNAVPGTAEVEGSLIFGQVGGSAGVENRGTMTMLNSTVSGNEEAGVQGVGGTLELRYVTVANNRIGLSAFNGADDLSLVANSLIADNTGREDCNYGFGATLPTFMGENLDSDGSCSFPSSEDGVDSGLEPLQDNGGATLTHALEGDSPALNAASGDCPAEDQRGLARPFGPACDVGAFELGGTTMSATLEPGALTTVTPTSTTSTPTVIEETLCWKGPGPLYEVVSALAQGTKVEILGRGVEGDWWVIDNPRYQGVRCWAPGEDIDVQPNYDFPNTLFEIPPLPTATPQPGCLWYDQQQNEVCYPINSCPVDFEDSLGACTP